MRVQWTLALLFTSCLLYVQISAAQSEIPTRVTDQNRSGDLPFSTSVGTDVEHVDLASGALNVKIPLIHIPGRGIDAGAAQGTPLREYQIAYAVDHDPTVDDTCYNPDSTLPPLVAQPVGQRVTSITTILEDGATQSQKQFDYEPLTNLSYVFYPNYCNFYTGNQTPTTYTTSRGNVTEIREYDWGQGAPGHLLRRIDRTYLHNSNSTYLTYNIVSKVLQETTYDSASNTCKGGSQPCAQTQYEYDNYVANVKALGRVNTI